MQMTLGFQVKRAPAMNGGMTTRVFMCVSKVINVKSAIPEQRC